MNGSRYDLLQQTPGTPHAPLGTRRSSRAARLCDQRALANPGVSSGVLEQPKYADPTHMYCLSPSDGTPKALVYVFFVQSEHAGLVGGDGW